MKRLSFVLLIATSLILSGCAAAATPAPMAPQAGAPSFSGGAPVTEAPAPTSAALSNDALKAAQAGGSGTGSDVTTTEHSAAGRSNRRIDHRRPGCEGACRSAGTNGQYDGRLCSIG